MQKNIPYRVSYDDFKKLAYKDRVYAWLLAHSYNDPGEYHNYIYRDTFTYAQLGYDIHRTARTVSNHVQKLIDLGYLYEKTIFGKKVFMIPYSNPFEYLDGETVIALLRILPSEKTGSMEDLINTLGYIMAKKREADKIGSTNFELSSREILTAFGHSVGNEESYKQVRLNLTILQGAGIIKFKTINYKDRPGMPQQMFVYQVSDKGKASLEWLGNQIEEEK